MPNKLSRFSTYYETLFILRKPEIISYFWQHKKESFFSYIQDTNENSFQVDSEASNDQMR